MRRKRRRGKKEVGRQERKLRKRQETWEGRIKKEERYKERMKARKKAKKKGRKKARKKASKKIREKARE